MQDIATLTLVAAMVGAAWRLATPIIFAAIGEVFSERAGVLNIGIEGMMLLGAYGGFVAAYYSESFWLGFLAGGAGGTVVAMLMALLCIRLGMNQIVIGIALTIGAQGLTALLHHFQFARTYPRLSDAPSLAIPGLSDIPILGPVLFDRHPVVYLAILLTVALVWLYRHSYIGLNLEAAGDKPGALDAAGVSVLATRGWAVLATGFLAGVGGAYMANIGAGLFVPFMTNGAGFIGIVLAMLARGRPLWVLLGAALFGISLALTTALQVAGVNVPTDVVQMLPFAMVMLVLVIFARHSVLPPALGIPYVRGER
jgi:simple sugar transport system permease protein